MTQIPAGWYPDPDPAQTTAGTQRYWDGQQWTAHVQAPTYPSPQTPVPDAPTYPTYPSGSAGPPAYAQYPGTGYPDASTSRLTTPDGQPLAGWWSRVGALLVDGLIVWLVAGLLASPWLSQVFSAYGDLMSEAFAAAEGGGAMPDPNALLRQLAFPLFVVSMIRLAVGFVYHVGFLRWKAATPGKLLLGLRVRRRDTPGPLPWGTVLLRWVGQFGYSLIALVPGVGGVFGFYPVVDLLWPLWDGKKQALHDKVAGTNVVRRAS